MKKNKAKIDIKLRDTQVFLHKYITSEPYKENNTIYKTISKSYENQMSNIKKSHTGLKAKDRLNIYRDMYIARLIEVLTIDFPLLAEVLGDDFYSVMCSYIDKYPSQSNTLNYYGANVPNFFANYKHKQSKLLREVATLEWTIADLLFNYEESKVFTSIDFAKIPKEKWENIIFKAVPALKLFTFKYPVNKLMNILNNEKQIPIKIEKEKSHIVVNITNGDLWRYELEQDEFDLLTILLSDIPLGSAIEQWLETKPKKRTKLAEENLQLWFAKWIDEGYFANIEY